MTDYELHRLSYLLELYLREYHAPTVLFPNYLDKEIDDNKNHIMITRRIVVQKQMDKVNESNK